MAHFCYSSTVIHEIKSFKVLADNAHFSWPFFNSQCKHKGLFFFQIHAQDLFYPSALQTFEIITFLTVVLSECLDLWNRN